MIILLKGKVELKTDKFAIINVRDVGYRVFCAASVLNKLAQTQKAKLFTYQYLRESVSEFYGFLNFEDLEFFETLISVSGIGPKAALSVMMLAPVRELKQAIASGQKNLLTKVSGIGSKTAERIILELKDKVSASVEGIKQLSSDSEVIDALIGLGYTASQARGALKQVPGTAKGVENRIKGTLKILGK